MFIDTFHGQQEPHMLITLLPLVASISAPAWDAVLSETRLADTRGTVWMTDGQLLLINLNSTMVVGGAGKG